MARQEIGCSSRSLIMRLPKLSSADDTATSPTHLARKRIIPAYFSAETVLRRDALHAEAEDYDLDRDSLEILNELVSKSIEVGSGGSRKKRRIAVEDDVHQDALPCQLPPFSDWYMLICRDSVPISFWEAITPGLSGSTTTSPCSVMVLLPANTH